MAPLSKVALLADNCDPLNDDVSSGPYSMLFIEPKLSDDTFISNNSIDNILEQQNDSSDLDSLGSRKPDRNNEANETFVANQNTFLNNTCTYEILEKQNSSNSSDEFNDTITENILDETLVKKSHGNFNLNFTIKVNETVNQEVTTVYSPSPCEKKVFGRTRTFDPKPLTDTLIVSKNYPTFDFEKCKKRSSKIFDISLEDVDTTIINSANSLSPSVEVKAFATNQSDTPLSERNLNYLPINKSCESLLNDSTVEVKRRRTSNPKNQKIDAILLKNLPNSLDKPSSLPQLRNSLNASSPPRSAPALNKLSHSTPVRGEFTDALLRKLRISAVGSTGTSDKNTNYDDDSSKRNSLEFEESLGILTPDQMIDGTIFTSVQSRSPSLEYDGNINEFESKTQEICHKSELASPRDSSLGILDENVAMKNCLGLTLEVTSNKEIKESDLQSPNLTSMTDCSLGILDVQVISNLTLKTDTTVNMELPLDSVDKSKDFKFTRLEQTPSPEELPLDPTPVVESDSKTEPTKSKTTNSFITSITSITSLDTGYQGDGEMSRPASRGPDNSPLTRRPLPRPQPRRPDPMTDSDFYTESDADNHEDNPLRGDRRAQVIDGTLYGVDPQAAADIYANNRENMDSSGIFTDLENNTRNEEDMPNEVPDASPSDASTKTISENSQNNLQEVLEKNSSKLDGKDVDKTVQKENPKKRNAPSPVVSSPSSISSPRHGAKEENAAKKYKMPKRDVASKVKAMLEPNLIPQSEKKSVKKPVGRWDAVMKKISTNEQSKTNLKEVKSKVFDNVNVKKVGVQRVNERKPMITRPAGNPKSPNSKTLTVVTNTPEGTMKSPSRRNFLSPSSAVLNKKSPVHSIQLTPTERRGIKPRMPKSEPRRIRNRTSASSTPKNIGSNVESSIHSSLSDLSAGTIPPKKILGSAKKRDVVQVTQVLTANKLSPRNQQQQTALENKKNATLHPSSSNESKASRTSFSPKDKKQPVAKECGRGTVKGGRTSPSVRPPTQTRVPAKQVPRVAEALAVLVQHLVFNVEAYQVPRLKRQVERLHEEQIEQARLLEEERKRCQNDIADLTEKHRNQLTELNNQHAELVQYLRAEKEQAEQNLCKQHEEQLVTLKKEFDKLQRTHEESLDILREENDSIREQIDEKQLEIEKVRHESIKLKKDYESKEVLFKEHSHKLEQQATKLRSDLEDRIKNVIEENKRLRDENDRLLSYGDDKEIGLQEVQSLRAVLELKQKEVGELRKALAEASQKAEILVGAEEKARFLNARCEDLQLQLQRKSEYEQSLLQENQKLKDSFKEEANQKKRLSQHNEELKWKLKQNKEVISKVLEQTGDSASFNRSLLSSSFSEKHSSSKINLERTLSFRERTYSNKSNVSLEDSIRPRKSKNSIDFEVEDLSPPTSPKVKGVVEKSDSVSYVLDLDESPDVVASRLVRRSFRNTTPPKSTPTKSPCNKRPRTRNSLSQSASSSAIITTSRNEFDRPKSASVRNGECDNENIFIWTSSVTSTPKTHCEKYESCESSNSSMKLEDNLDLDEDHDVDIQLPALPSELDRQSARPLPSPKHLAGESMVSESNSEDESTSSSQL